MATHSTGPQKNREVGDENARSWFSNLPVQPGPDYAIYFNDFLNTADYAAGDWTITTTEAGSGNATEAIASDERHGALLITNDDADNDLDSLQLNEETFKLEAGEKLWYETRVKINDVDQVDVFLGLCITDTTPLDTSDRVGFGITDGNASINCISEKNTTETSTDSGSDAADAAYVTLGFYWDGISKVRYYVDRSLKASHTTNVPDDENLAVTMHFQNGEAAAQTLTVDYIYVCAERA